MNMKKDHGDNSTDYFECISDWNQNHIQLTDTKAILFLITFLRLTIMGGEYQNEKVPYLFQYLRS